LPVWPRTNPYFDFRTLSSAEVIRIDDRYYMLYEGVRGPGPGDPGDSQFGLGLARSLTDRFDGPWEKHPANPILVDLPGNIGLGHADLVIIDGQTVLYTALEEDVRSRLALEWKAER
jgi:beta-xylosidase